MAESRYRAALAAVLIAFAALRILYIAETPFGLSPDEAHYWEWSRRLDLSYYSKGPGVAYVIAFFTSLFGDTVMGVRIGAVVFSTLGSYAVYLLGKEFNGCEKTGFYSALLLNLTPVFSAGSILMTTDVLFLFFWAAAVVSAKRAVDGRGGWWYAAGVFTGLGFLSKYTMVMIYPCLLLFLIASWRKGGREWLKRREPYAALAISAALATPVIFWNILHGQVTIKHTMGQAHVGSGGLSLQPALEFLASQAGLLTPFIFIGLIYGVWRAGVAGLREGNRPLLMGFFTSAPLFLFFLAVSLHGKVQANWAIASYVTATPLAVGAFSALYGKAGKGGRRLLLTLSAATLLLGAAVSALFYLPWGLEAAGFKRVISGPPYNRVTGWAELGDKVSKVKQELEMAGRTFVMSDTYQITSELAFYTRGNPVTYNAYTGSRRMNQYDLWPGFEGLKGYNAVYVKGGLAEAEESISSAFDSCAREVFTVSRNGSPLKEFSIFRCYGFKGMEKGAAGSY